MSSRHVSRRMVAHGAAWSLPVAAVAVAVPAYAASPVSPPTLTVLGGCRCGSGGGTSKPYRLDVTFTNNGTDTYAITNPDVIIPGTTASDEALQSSPPQNNLIPPGTKTIRFTFVRGNNPATDPAVTFTYTLTNQTTNVAVSQSATLPVTWGTCSSLCA